jgi:simple sugar transport system permease protein
MNRTDKSIKNLLFAFLSQGVTVLLSFMSRGATQIASDFNFNKHASNILIGIILFFILGSEFFINYRIVFRRKEAES